MAFQFHRKWLPSKEKAERSAYSSVSDQSTHWDLTATVPETIVFIDIAIRGMASWMARRHVNNSMNNWICWLGIRHLCVERVHWEPTQFQPTSSDINRPRWPTRFRVKWCDTAGSISDEFKFSLGFRDGRHSLIRVPAASFWEQRLNWYCQR